MLENVLISQHSLFAALAEAWLVSGAASFSVFRRDALLAQWPAGAPSPTPSLIVPIYHDNQILGDLRVSGINSSAAHMRLTSDANLVAHLVRLEDDLEVMTAELVDSQDRLLAVYQLTRSLRNYSTVEETFQSLLFESLRLIKVNSGFVVFTGKDGTLMIEQFPAQSQSEEAIYGVLRRSQLAEREVLLAKPAELTGFSQSVQNLCFLPIRIRGSISAGIGLINKPGGFAMPDVKLARALVEQSSVHIEQVLLHQETAAQRRMQLDLDLARRVQMRLLPQQLPEIAGLDIYARSKPAYQISGDFYDFIWQPPRSLIFAVGDVSGKALSAALLMTMARTAIHSKASYMPNPTPELVMRNSHEDLFGDFVQVGMFATVFIGQYQPRSRTLMYANAGHSPVLFCPQGDRARLLTADSPPIGVLSTSLCKNHTLPFGPGDVLVIATDGLNEAISPNDEMFGYDRLLELVSEGANLSARALADSLFSAVEEFGMGRPQDDDQTLIVIKGVAV